MVIRFLCPQGHKVHCPDEQAGRAAKCPQCGTRFRVPAPGAMGDQPAEPLDPTGSNLEAAAAPPPSPTPGGSSATLSATPAARPKQPQIEFLCPNGHRLFGPATLQGHPGQCPECGSRFRIPSYDDVSEEEETAGASSIGVADGGAMHEEPDASDDETPAGGEDTYQLDIQGGEPSAEEEAWETPAANGQQHSWATLFPVLWSQRSAGVIVELMIEGGGTILAERFAHDLSQHDHGVFGVRQSNGTYVLEAVLWSAVTRVSFRGLKRLPDELFG